jgi:hypothetical protein
MTRREDHPDALQCRSVMSGEPRALGLADCQLPIANCYLPNGLKRFRTEQNPRSVAAFSAIGVGLEGVERNERNQDLFLESKPTFGVLGWKRCQGQNGRFRTEQDPRSVLLFSAIGAGLDGTDGIRAFFRYIN